MSGIQMATVVVVKHLNLEDSKEHSTLNVQRFKINLDVRYSDPYCTYQQPNNHSWEIFCFTCKIYSQSQLFVGCTLLICYSLKVLQVEIVVHGGLSVYLPTEDCMYLSNFLSQRCSMDIFVHKIISVAYILY